MLKGFGYNFKPHADFSVGKSHSVSLSKRRESGMAYTKRARQNGLKDKSTLEATLETATQRRQRNIFRRYWRRCLIWEKEGPMNHGSISGKRYRIWKLRCTIQQMEAARKGRLSQKSGNCCGKGVSTEEEIRDLVAKDRWQSVPINDILVLTQTERVLCRRVLEDHNNLRVKRLQVIGDEMEKWRRRLIWELRRSWICSFKEHTHVTCGRNLCISECPRWLNGSGLYYVIHLPRDSFNIERKRFYWCSSGLPRRTVDFGIFHCGNW